MSDALSENTLNMWSEGSSTVSGQRVVGDVASGRLTNAEYVGPLFDLLPEVLGVESSVTKNMISFTGVGRIAVNVRGSMPELNVRTSPVESRVCIADEVSL